MDVAQKYFALLSFCFFISACSDNPSDTSALSKTTGNECGNLAIKNENILRWKNGKITRAVFRNQKAKSEYLMKYKNQISDIEDNFRISAPQPKTLNLLGYSGELNWGMKTIGAEFLWNKNIFGNGVVVAIIDSGIDANHNQLQNQLHSNPSETFNGIDDDGNGLIDDVHGYDFIEQSGDLSDNSGHGTHIAGVIAADHSRGSVTGVAPQAKLLVYDFFGSSKDGTVFDAIRSVRVAVQAGAKIINASWGGSGCSTALKAEIDALAQKDVLFITAAGNERSNIDIVPSYPAAFSSKTQITVGAMTLDEYTAGFSNYGSKVDLVAPGVSIESTYPGNSYFIMDGTSMATPFVSGAAAILWSAFPKAKAGDIKKALLDSAKVGFYHVKTRGSLNVEAAYALLEKQFPTPLQGPR